MSSFPIFSLLWDSQRSCVFPQQAPLFSPLFMPDSWQHWQQRLFSFFVIQLMMMMIIFNDYFMQRAEQVQELYRNKGHHADYESQQVFSDLCIGGR